MKSNDSGKIVTAVALAVSLALFALTVYLGSVSSLAQTNNSAYSGGVSAPAHESETERPRETQTEHPRETETEHPRETETARPEMTETEHPRETETHVARETETENPRETETEHPRETETAHPEGTRTAQPHETETEHPRETETHNPQPTGTARPSQTALAQVPGTGSRTFPETKKSVSGVFLSYWDKNGGVAQQGFPISSPMQETSDLNGKSYAVQYFERAVFEYHPENVAPFNVLLSQLGTFRYKAKYSAGAPNQKANTSAGSILFPQTSKRVGGKFLQYWNAHGGVAQQGYPISDEFTEVSDLNGKTYMVQYFERAVFEYHPENAGTPYEVLLSELGTFQFGKKYGGR